MNRKLVYEGASRTHPFRSHVRRVSARNRAARDDNDWRLFVLSFGAFFVCFTTFIF